MTMICSVQELVYKDGVKKTNRRRRKDTEKTAARCLQKYIRTDILHSSVRTALC